MMIQAVLGNPHHPEYGEVVQFLHIDRKHLHALEHRVKAVDLLHLAIGFDRVANLQILQQLHLSLIHISSRSG